MSKKLNRALEEDKLENETIEEQNLESMICPNGGFHKKWKTHGRGHYRSVFLGRNRGTCAKCGIEVSESIFGNWDYYQGY